MRPAVCCFVSGQLASPRVDRQGGIVPEAEQALANVATALRTAGVGLDSVVRVTVYLISMDDRIAMDEVYIAALPEPLPARTCIAVAELPFGARIELDVVATAAH